MKQQVLIIIGAVIILILIVTWIYLLFFGTPKNIEDVITNLGPVGEIVDNQDNNNQNTTDTETTDTTDKKKLRQLTTKSVAGFSEINSENTTEADLVYFVEMGTGHIYSIDLGSGEEARISGTTVPGVNTASVSPNGDFVAMGNRNNTKNFPLTLGKINSNNETEIQDFNSITEQFTINKAGEELLYLNRDALGSVGYSYNLDTGKTTTLFNLPFFETYIQWGNSGTETHYAFPKPSYLLEGYLYQIKGNKMSRLPAAGYGLSALANDKIIAYNASKKGNPTSYIFDRETNINTEISLIMLPEKCIISDSLANLICAYDASAGVKHTFPDDWYKGNYGFKDSLWLVSGSDLNAQLLVNTFTESGREIDITNLSIGNSEKVIYFINKNDNTLWMYEL